MRIEKRGEEEYLVGVVGRPNDCRAKFDGTYSTICTHHLDGEHVSVGELVDDNTYRVDVRWPIVSERASGSEPARTAPRFLTPAEARTAQAPYVAKEIERINAGLAMGVRSFSVNAPLFEEIERGLESAGWSAVDASTRDGRTWFVVRERTEGE